MALRPRNMHAATTDNNQDTIVCEVGSPKAGQYPSIVFSSYETPATSGEQFIPHHGIAYMVSGSLIVHEGNKTYTFRKGDYIFYRKNYLSRFVKDPSPDGKFESITVVLDESVLRQFSIKYRFYAGTGYPPGNSVTKMDATQLLADFFHSLKYYAGRPMPDHLLQLRRQEAIMVLLQNDIRLQDLLFDFSMPGKQDLEAFMNRNFRYNVDLKRFAYLTGRSLATFKRDFEKTFHMPPNRWLQQRRLEEAYYLIKEKKRKPSEIYLDLGFERMSHFSHSFKQFFGVNPSGVPR